MVKFREVAPTIDGRPRLPSQSILEECSTLPLNTAHPNGYFTNFWQAWVSPMKVETMVKLSETDGMLIFQLWALDPVKQWIPSRVDSTLDEGAMHGSRRPSYASPPMRSAPRCSMLVGGRQDR